MFSSYFCVFVFMISLSGGGGDKIKLLLTKGCRGGRRFMTFAGREGVPKKIIFDAICELPLNNVINFTKQNSFTKKLMPSVVFLVYLTRHLGARNNIL